MITLKNILPAAAALLLLSACSADKSRGKETVRTTVQVYTPGKSAGEGVYLSGQVTARQTAVISTRVMGYVRKIHVKPGDQVSQGQLLLSVSNDELLARKAQARAMLAEAEAATQNARKDHERFKRLHEQNSVSDKELENVQLQYTSMDARLQIARQSLNEIDAMLSYTDIESPFTGVVTRKMIDEGSMANPGVPLLAVEQKGEMLVEASVPENYIAYVKKGDKAGIQLKSITETLEGTVIELSPSAYGTGGQYSVKLSLGGNVNPAIHPGMYATIFVSAGRPGSAPDKLMIDAASVVYRDQLTGVYIVNEQNQAILRWVRLGRQAGDRVEVLSGINPADRIIRKAESKLYNGQEITIAE